MKEDRRAAHAAREGEVERAVQAGRRMREREEGVQGAGRTRWGKKRKRGREAGGAESEANVG